MAGGEVLRQVVNLLTVLPDLEPKQQRLQRVVVSRSADIAHQLLKLVELQLRRRRQGAEPSNVLTQVHHRHFFTLTTTDATPEHWEHTAEQVLRFTLFWAPLDALPPLRSSRASWLSMLIASS